MFRYGGMSSVPGAPGNLMAGIDLPFGGGQQYKELQKEYQPGAPRPTGTSPVRIFPPNAPGREGAIDVQFRQALNPGFLGAIGNMGGMQFAQSQFPSTPVYYDEQMKQLVPRPVTPSSTPVKNYPGLGIAPKVPFV